MKNSFLIALVAFATAGIISCTKTDPISGGGSTTPTERTVASDLMSVTFESKTDDGITYLQADRSLNGITAADVNNHYSFVYAIRPDGQHQLLPFNIATDDANFTVSYGLSEATLSIRIDSDVQDHAIDAAQFQDMQFQVLLVSAEDYNRLNVDWSDYFAVFAAIRSLPLPAVHLESDSQAGSNN